MQNIRDIAMVGIVALSAFGGAYLGSTPKGQAEGQGQAVDASTVTDGQEQKTDGTSGSFFSMPEVNDENCKPANINNVSSLHREEFAEKCFKRGAVERKPSKAY